MSPDSDLLRPSLSPGHGAPAAIYSVRTSFFSSFLGGPVASALITLINARRLHRLARDYPIAMAALAAAIALRWAMSRHVLSSAEAIFGDYTEMSVLHIMGFAFFGIGYLLHAPYHRSHTFLELPTVNGLGAGILCILIGTGIQWGLLLVIPG